MITLPLNLPSRIHRVEWTVARTAGIELWVKREDEIHPAISGNKWRKLKGHLLQCYQSQHNSIVSFGGAFSNHIYALAACAPYVDLPIHIYVRGEEDIQNPTLKYAREKGAHIHYLSREAYREKESDDFIQQLSKTHGKPYIIPEGGSGSEAEMGVKEMMDEIDSEMGFDRLLVCAGTGTTSIHMINHPSSFMIDVYGALKGNWLNKTIKEAVNNKSYNYVEAHGGGYAKTAHPLIETINAFYQETKIPIDPIYNGKLIYELIEQIRNGAYASGEKLLWIHTGGLQGIDAYNYMAIKKERPLIEIKKGKDKVV